MIEQILATLKAGPLSARAIAKKIKRRVADVNVTCASLQESGRIRREGIVWCLVPQSLQRCAGTNVEGVRCGREAAEGSDRCSLHQADATEPRWRFPWTIEQARDQVRAFGLSPESAGRYADGDPPTEATTIEAAFRLASDEARAFLQWKKDPWLEQFDNEQAIEILLLLLEKRPQAFDAFFDDQETGR